MDSFLFNGWWTLARTLTIGVMAYASLLFILRITGKRTLSKMNAFDFVVTVALGSTLATILLNRNVSLAEGALAFTILTGLQYVITWASVRANWVKRTVTGEPRIVFRDGRFLGNALRQERVTQDEIRSAIRASGFAVLDRIQAVIMETDGSFSVIPVSDPSDMSGSRQADPEENSSLHQIN